MTASLASGSIRGHPIRFDRGSAASPAKNRYSTGPHLGAAVRTRAEAEFGVRAMVERFATLSETPAREEGDSAEGRWPPAGRARPGRSVRRPRPGGNRLNSCRPCDGP